MNAKLYVLLLFTVLYIFGAQWWYSNRITGACCGPELIVDPAAAGEDVDLPLAFRWENADPLLQASFEDYKKNTILGGMTDDNILQITGYYYSEENAPEGFDNMGLARAVAIRELLKGDLPAERIDISSRRQLNADSTLRANPFTGASYSWKAPLRKEETTIIALEDEVTIYFPFNSTVRDKNTKVDEYLQQLAERLKQTEEKIAITGHTDNVGEEAANLDLGLRRAESIKSILVSNGINASRISIDSKGERQPATSNETEEGRYRNRRTVLSIIK